ncbi:NAD-dependent epimerase/dehydratase family protein [Subtercola endophyticus]|uniref:NAD-dependent epimerase/dehydratase family protein n=1 Tax=Subtercola endophyticus TaxID=2895559 RepID=UPI001E334D2F|nr:NAD-dependent epimerase/dehydratase family protein [Subtercola endophyticus]UFS57941.1 NAD-dependent epimerase/dehydratase family protein [Subtercola endophyticus]
MRLLVLGGTAWLGQHVVSAALKRGHFVAALARGESGAVPGGAVVVTADRNRPDAYAQVRTQDWDAVLDVSRHPGQVREATAALRERSETYIFVSSGNVYADTSVPHQNESAALLDPLTGDVMESMETYGEAKVACELALRESFGGDRMLVARSGLIGGPGDTFDRSGYWPMRFSKPAVADGRVLVPDVPELLTQLIDVRDLAGWLVDAAENKLHGTFNTTGETMPLPQHLDVARHVAGHTGPLVKARQNWLIAQDIEPWAGERSLPLWLPLPEYAGFSSRDSSAARAAGLTCRPLEETLADTLAWERTRPEARQRRYKRRAGLTDFDEAELLSLLSSG